MLADGLSRKINSRQAREDDDPIQYNLSREFGAR